MEEQNNELILTNGVAKHVSALLAELAKSSQPGLNKEQIEEICLDMIAAACIPTETKLTLVTEDREIEIAEKQHYLFPLIAKLVSIKGINLALTGPKGSGKTQALLNIAKAMGINYVLQPFHAQLAKSELLGYMNATGEYVPSSFYTAFREGKLYIADEFDCANPSLATIINSAIANRVLTFPNNETLEANKNFSFCACMNTVGLGANSEYCGRNRLDAATLDRFVVLYVPYDDALEASFVGITEHQKEVNIDNELLETGDQCLALVRDCRDFFAKQYWNQSISPRATIYTKQLSEAGIGKYWIVETILSRGLNETQKETLKSHFLQ